MNVVLEAQHAMTSLQLGIWGMGALSPQADPGQSPGGGLGGEALEILQLASAKKMVKYTLMVHHLHKITIV